MAFPRKLLTPGEEIVAESHPNWSVLLQPAVLAAVVIAACIAVLVAWSSAPTAVGYVLAAVAVIALCWFALKIVSWRSRLLVVTTTRVVYRWGVLRRTGREIPLDRVQDVTFHQSFVERLLGAGSLTIESAGRSGQEPFPDIRHPAAMQSLINQLVTGDRESWRRAAVAAQAPPAPPAPPVYQPPVPAPPQGGPSVTTQLPPVPQGSQPFAASPPPRQESAPPAASPPAQPPVGGATGPLADELRDLERLHEAGVLTDAEFDEKRRSLLGLG